MKKDELDKSFTDRLKRLVRSHQTMLGDGHRNKLLYEALKDNVSEKTRFLDIGAGTGVWAIIAAKLGAKRVVAVEIEECLVPIIYKHAKENGVADRIEIIQGNSDDVRIRGKFDLIVSELFGSDVFGEQTIKSFINIRKRFLAKNGTLIPQIMEKYAVPVRTKRNVQNLPAELPIKCSFIDSLKSNFHDSLPLSQRGEIEVLAEPKKLLEVDFRKDEKPPASKNLSCSWKLKDLSKVNAFAVYNRSVFTDEIKMDTFDSQSWRSAVFNFQPVEEKSGEIEFAVTLDPGRLHWKISLPSHPKSRVQIYSPGHAAAGIKMAQEATPYRKF
ncbi:MAG: methyltransferase domain-containing protein [Pyrinomonadaceae bacterium]|nr:methyltransferase domain-containing protein [Pyrinomonadaceae bacterium]